MGCCQQWSPALAAVARVTLGALGLFAYSCGSSSTTNVLGPSATKCGVTIRNNSPTVPAAGGTGSVTVDTARECSWSAHADAAWITLGSSDGQGPATISYSVAANPQGVQRRGGVLVADQRVDVVQEAAPCRYEVAPSREDVGSDGGDFTVNLTATPACAWTAASNAPWISSGAPANGEGSATVRFTVAANPGDARSGTITLGGAAVTVSQAAVATPPAPPAPPPPTSPPPSPPPGPPPPTPAPTCTYGVSPTSKTAAAAGEEVLVTVTATPGCAWTAASQAAWITVKAGASGAGSGTVDLLVAANTGAARTGTATIAGQQVTIAQQAQPPAPCTYSLSAASAAIASSGGQASVDVRAGATCAWTAVSQANWITIVNGASGTGNGSVTLAVAANAGQARAGSVKIADQTFTIQQDGVACTYSIKPAYYDAGRGPDAVLVQVTAPAGCAWTATSPVAWAAISDGATGSGSGTVRITIDANTGAPRSATLTIAGTGFALTQQGPQCSDTIAPLSQSFTSAGGDVAVTVTAAAGCTWTAASDVPWIAVTDGASGVGNGTVHLGVQTNATTAARTGTVQIAGQTFTAQQDGMACTYTISPTSFDATTASADITVAVTTDAGCAWTASSPVAWATISSGSAGTGSGSVRLLVEANTGAARSAVITIAGQPFTLRQAGVGSSSVH